MYKKNVFMFCKKAFITSITAILFLQIAIPSYLIAANPGSLKAEKKSKEKSKLIELYSQKRDFQEKQNNSEKPKESVYFSKEKKKTLKSLYSKEPKYREKEKKLEQTNFNSNESDSETDQQWEHFSRVPTDCEEAEESEQNQLDSKEPRYREKGDKEQGLFSQELQLRKIEKESKQVEFSSQQSDSAIKEQWQHFSRGPSVFEEVEEGTQLNFPSKEKKSKQRDLYSKEPKYREKEDKERILFSNELHTKKTEKKSKEIDFNSKESDSETDQQWERFSRAANDFEETEESKQLHLFSKEKKNKQNSFFSKEPKYSEEETECEEEEICLEDRDTDSTYYDEVEKPKPQEEYIKILPIEPNEKSNQKKETPKKRKAYFEKLDHWWKTKKENMEQYQQSWKMRNAPSSNAPSSNDFLEKQTEENQINQVCSKRSALYNIGFSASYLYWYAYQGGLDLGTLYNSASAPAEGNKTVNFDFNYHSAFKVGFSMQPDLDRWGVNAEYTRVHLTEKESQNHTAQLDAISTDWLRNSSATATNVDARWHLSYDIIDLNVTKPFCFETCFLFSPHIGLRGGWIDQLCNVDYTINSLTVKSRNRFDSSLIGPRIGAVGSWLWTSQLRLFGSIAYSFFYQHFNKDTKQDNATTPSLIALADRDKDNTVNQSLDAALGLGWKRCLVPNKTYLNLALSYDFSLYTDQNVFKSFQNTTAIKHSNDRNNLLLHGLTVKVGFDF